MTYRAYMQGIENDIQGGYARTFFFRHDVQGVCARHMKKETYYRGKRDLL